MASPAVFNEVLNTTINFWKKNPVTQITQHNALRSWMIGTVICEPTSTAATISKSR